MDIKTLQQRLVTRGYALTVDGQAGPKTYAALFAFVGRHPIGEATARIGAAAVQQLPAAAITTPLRLAHALSQWAVESKGFSDFEEDLNYSAERLTEVWPGRFPNLAAAAPYAGRPQALANKTYGGRNGNTAPDDGWRYRGRGLTMLTGLANYVEASKLTGLDLVGNPDAVVDPATGLRVACAYWAARKINAAADRDDVVQVRRLVNGGTIGLHDAQTFLARAKQVLS